MSADDEDWDSWLAGILGEIDAEIARRERELCKLRAAANVLRGPETGTETGITPASGPASKEFADMRIADVSAVILAEHPDGLRFREVARIAIERGYRSNSPRNPDNDPKKIRLSFYAIMKKESARFDLIGRVFRLKSDPPRESTELAENEG